MRQPLINSKKIMFLFEYYIAKRQVSGRKKRKTFSGSVVNIVVFGIALCVAVMIIAISILTGFKKEIRNKVVGFGSHIQILKMDSNYSFVTQPISSSQPFLEDLNKLPGIAHIQRFATIPGIMKSAKEYEGIILKGVDSKYDWTFFKKSMKLGEVLNINDSVKTNNIMISSYLAKRLNIVLNGELAVGVIDTKNQTRFRRFKVQGIYETNLQDFDKQFVLCDLRHVVSLNNWGKDIMGKDSISGFEIQVANFDKVDVAAEELYQQINYSVSNDQEPLRVITIKEKYPQIFDWLNLQDMNITVFLIIMLLVTGFNMISGLLILILESTPLIGLLKALGTNNNSIRKIFLIESFFLTLKGLLWGNLIGLSLCLFQKYTQIIKLEVTSYYISFVPINIQFMDILLLNLGTIVTIILFLLLPSIIVSKLDPVKAIRYN